MSTPPPPVIRGTADKAAASQPADLVQFLDRRHAIVDLGDEPLPEVNPDSEGDYGSPHHDYVKSAQQASFNLRYASADALAIHARDTAGMGARIEAAATAMTELDGDLTMADARQLAISALAAADAATS